MANKRIIRGSSSKNADIKKINYGKMNVEHDETVCHPNVVHISKYCTLSWYNFQQAMYNANQALHFVPLRKLTSSQRLLIKQRYDNRYTPPDYEDNNS